MTGKKSKTGAEPPKEANAAAAGAEPGPQPEEQKPGAPPAAEAPAAPEKKELERLREQVLRLQADYDNYKKRTLREKEEILSRANAELLEALLPLLDHLELGIQAAARHAIDGQILEGMKLIFAQANETLGRFGLNRIETAGKTFDPAMSEAIMRTQDPQIPDGIVTEETRPGYLYKSRLLRPAQVVVNTAPEHGHSKNGPHAPEGGKTE